MRRRLSRRGKVRSVSYLLALLAVLAGFVAKGYGLAAAYRMQIEQEYQQSFLQLTSSVGKIDAAMRKSLYASSQPMVAQLAAEIAREAAAAQGAMSRLPFRFEELEQTAKFLSQSGDFSSYLAKAAGAGALPGAEERGQLKALSESASAMAERLSELQHIIGEENLRISALLGSGRTMPSGEGGPAFFEDSFSELEREFPDTPSLIYDGPFSEHALRRSPAFLEGKDEVGAEEAEALLLGMLGLGETQLELAYEVSGDVPRYCFEGYLDGGEISACVTKQGGYLYSLLSSRDIGEVAAGHEEAIGTARRFLDRLGFSGMRESYWSTAGNFMLVNFAYEQDGVLCYPDLIKVGVALDTGEVVQFDAAGYMMNHPGERDIPRQLVDEREAEAGLAEGLALEHTRLCVIPSASGAGIVCYELACRDGDGTHVMIYKNAETGLEERILILIEDETGTLAF